MQNKMTSTGELVRSITLGNGLALEFFDKSNRYFGDYHRIHVVLVVSISVERFWKGDNGIGASAAEAAAELGSEVLYEKTLERMAVPTAQVDEVKNQLIDEFIATGGRYLDQPEFASRYLANLFTERRKVIRPFRFRHAPNSHD